MSPAFSVLRVVPWGTLLKQAPLLIAAAERLVAASRGRQQDPPGGGDLDTLRRRLRTLDEEHQQALAVLKQLADQVTALSAAAHAADARLRTLQFLAAGALVVAAVACVLAIVR